MHCSREQLSHLCFRESCNEALDVMVENVTVLKAMTSVMAGGFGVKSAVLRTTVARLMDKLVTQIGAERLMGASKDLQDQYIFSAAVLKMLSNF
jgi:hypothetical protein